MPREWLNSPGQSHGPSLCSTCWHCFPNTWLGNVEGEVTKTGLRENWHPVLRGSSFDVWENLLGTSAKKTQLGTHDKLPCRSGKGGHWVQNTNLTAAEGAGHQCLHTSKPSKLRNGSSASAITIITNQGRGRHSPCVHAGVQEAHS